MAIDPLTNAAASPADLNGTAAAVEPVLDPGAIARLAELDPTGKNRLVERVLTAFKASSARLMPQLEAARIVPDLAAIRLVAHTLKSSSGSIGANRLSRLCANVEGIVRAESTDGLASAIDEMVAAMDEVLGAIDQSRQGAA